MSTQEFSIKCSKMWQTIHSEIFSNRVPKRCEWTKQSDVIEILNIIGKQPNSNHTFYPDGGGLDLLGAAKSREDGCIELLTSTSNIIKLNRLIFEGVDDELEWNYFRIETKALEPSGVYENNSTISEELVELEPLHYVRRSHWDTNEYHGEDLPASARLIRRYFKGAFVIFKKSSIYNNNTRTYDGRHEKLGERGFREHIEAASQAMRRTAANI